jgi:hypothetical protein
VGGKKGDQCVDDAAIFNANRQTVSDRFCLLCVAVGVDCPCVWRLLLRPHHTKKKPKAKKPDPGPGPGGQTERGRFPGAALAGS